MKNSLPFLFLGIFLAAITCPAKEPPSARIVDLTAADGIKLKASYFSAGKPGPGVLLLHQCDHDRKIWDGLAQQLASAGINVLTFDLRGFGESGDGPHDKVTPEESEVQVQKWPGDIDTAYQYLKSQPGVQTDAIGAGGASCGVNNAIHAAIRHSDVKSLVLLSGPSDLEARRFMRKSNLPVFLAVADDDQYPDMVQHTEWLYLLSRNPGKKFTHYTTGHHGAEIFPVHPELPAAIVDWYITTLIKTPGRAPASTDTPGILDEVHNLDLLEQPGGPAKLMQVLSESRRKDSKASFISELMIEGIAYDHLQAKDTKQALEILKVDAAAYPNMPNVYDALGEVYLTDGQRDLARQNSQKALDLLPLDTIDPQAFKDSIKASAEQRLKQLSSPK